MTDRHQPSKRIFYFRIIIVLVFGVLIGRLYYLQICKNERFKKLSEGYRTSVIPIRAPRGKIYDRDGKVLVANKLTYTVSLIPAKVNNLPQVLTKLTNILEVKEKKVKKQIKNTSSNHPLIVERNISQKELIRLKEVKPQLSGVIIEQTPMREYVYNDLASHVLGYVGEISGNKLRKKKDEGYRLGDLIGKTGLELMYEKYLRGKKGKKLIEVNSQGQKVKNLAVQKPVPGYNLVLNLDYELQKKATQLLRKKLKKLTKEAKASKKISKQPKGGAVIVANPENSSILALASVPTYNPNKFISGISQDKWKQLTQSYRQPLLNRAVSTSVPPGSIFKIVTASASMEELGVNADTKFFDPGYYKVGGIKFKNWYPGGQGKIDFVNAIAWSNNTVFYKLGHRLYKEGKTLLQKYAREFGLGQKTKIDLNNEADGLVPDPKWRQKTFDQSKNQIWYPGYTINMSIGQGNLQASPVQLLNLVCSVANGGRLYQPMLVDKIVNSEGELIKDLQPKLLNKIPVTKRTFRVVKKGLSGVTSYGTAGDAFDDFPIEVAGKTGTAQTGQDRPNHAWFASFAPVKDPEIAVVVFIEYGRSSGNALSVARGVFKEYFNVKSTTKKEQSQKETESSSNNNLSPNPASTEEESGSEVEN